MKKQDYDLLAYLEENLRKLFVKQQEVRRWKHKKFATPEYLPEHHFKTGFVTQLLLAMEWRQGNPHHLDGYQILQCAINHDLGESSPEVGDHPWGEKAGSAGFELKMKEKLAFVKLIDELVPAEVRNFFPLPIDMGNTHDVNHRFWDAIEVVGYLYFALAELRQPVVPQHTEDFERVFGSQWETLRQYSKMFPNSVGVVGAVILAERAKIMGEDKPQVNDNPAPPQPSE